jgi:transposase
VHDVVGLYLNPPEHALVISAGEKISIQALDRTQTELPIKKGRCGTVTHDYKRNGTTTLFAAIEMAEGRVISMCMDTQRHQRWIKFLKLIDKEIPPDLDIHLIVDNYATHKHENVTAWMKQHPRFHAQRPSAVPDLSNCEAVTGFAIQRICSRFAERESGFGVVRVWCFRADALMLILELQGLQ